MMLAVVDRAMGKGGEIKIAAELTVDAYQYVEIEAGGDAGRIVIGPVEHALVLLQVGADDHVRSRAQDLRCAPQEAAGFVRFEIADRRAREKADLRHLGDRLR